ncbi:YciI family protein [Actinoplanes sp. NPDC024001]|uniref:YciI family protein n=1 Tax=Actinoplanes sp. NPDC024001 TaxID=3154598 RepID=UPI00340EEF5B
MLNTTTKETTMKYLLLAYTPAAAWDAATADTPTDDALAAFAAYQKFEQELVATGEFVTSEGLGHPAVSTTIRKTPDGVTATDGPFAELKEVLASFAVIDVASHDRAVDIVTRIVDVLGEPIEIRPIMGEDFAA